MSVPVVGCRRVSPADAPYQDVEAASRWNKFGQWPCSWISLPEAAARPLVAAYRCRFTLAEAATWRLHVTADERYELYVDGVRVGRGPERGDDENWFFETYEIAWPAGAHQLVARVWSLGPQSPFAQASVRHGLLVAGDGPHDALIGTGVAVWEGRRLGGQAFTGPEITWGTGAQETVTAAAFDWGFEHGAGDGWGGVATVEPGFARLPFMDWAPKMIHLLRPGTLPAMRSAPAPAPVVRHLDAAAAGAESAPVLAAQDLAAERRAWQDWLAGGRLVIPPRTVRRAILDLEDYRCAYPAVTVSGGRDARLSLRWAEGLYDPVEGAGKGNRDQIEGKLFKGAGDTFLPDGGAGRAFAPLWWRAGRYVELRVETAGDALTLDRLDVEETGYPLVPAAEFAAADPRLAAAQPPMLRVMQMCMHETYMDCPYYEQMMYIGDTRLEVLTTYVLTADDRLPRKALRMFDASRRSTTSGLTASRWPVRMNQVIPPFSLWWLGMVHDYAQWRGDAEFVRSLMPGVRGVLDVYEGWIGGDGLLGPAPGWLFTDWTLGWRSWQPPHAPTAGMPPGADREPNGILNWQLVYILDRVAELEAWLGEPEHAARCRRRAGELARATDAAFWDEARGLYADTQEKNRFSEHAQCLALLSNRLPAARLAPLRRGLLNDPDLERVTVYFAHYLFEACRVLDATDTLLERMALWFGLGAQGFRTTPEEPEPARSDCHAWGAHPLYHYHASILGVRPADFGFRSVAVEPRLGPLAWARGCTPHPCGLVETEFRRTATGATAWQVTLPEGVGGRLRLNGGDLPLHGGRQSGTT
ncbi:MAG: alpha-L-rhamnosidase C-terminal domain-containing protein [Lentisphaeria bacterium]